MKNFDEAAAEWVRQHYPGEEPVVGSVEFSCEVSAYGGELDHDLEVYYDMMVRPLRGRVDGEWRHGPESKRSKSAVVRGDNGRCDIMQLIRELVDLCTETSTTVQVPKSPTVQLPL